MFNLFQYERLEKDEVKRQTTTAGQPKKLAKYLKERDEKADRYKQRIVEFMEQAADQPEQYVLPDDFKGGVEAQNEKMMMYGRERFKYTTNSKDIERIQTAENINSIYDTQPLNITEVRAWNLRPRTKGMELGPEVRFKSKLQMERIYDQLTSKISPYFTDHALSDPEVHNQIQNFVKSGQRQHQTFSATGFSSQGFSKKGFETGAASAYMASVSSSLRDSRLGNNICVLQPQKMMNELHKKSHFKGVTSFLIGQEASMQFKQSEKLVEAFSHIAKSIGRRRESRDHIQNGPRASTTKAGPRRNLNIVPNSALSQREGGFIHSQPDDESTPLRSIQKPALTSKQSPSLVKTGEDAKTLLMSRDSAIPTHTVKFKQNNAWLNSALGNNNTQGPLNFNSTMPQQSNTKEEQDPKVLTTNILKICNIMRPKHAKVMLVHKQTGRGGQGPMTSAFSSSSVGRESPMFSSQGGATGTFFYQAPNMTGASAPRGTQATQFTLLSPKSSVMD